MKFSIFISFFTLLYYSNFANAIDQTNIKFENGSALVRCMVPNGHSQISTELFNSAFEQWVNKLQQLANDGLISRAHYLSELKQGVFIVVVGDNRNDSLNNANTVINQMSLITEQAFNESKDEPSFDLNDVCQKIEIGPVAVLPMKNE